MLPGMNPRKMNKMMQRMGIQQKEIPAKEVIIRCEDKDLIIKNPQVSKINMMGQETIQVLGEITEKSIISEEDIETVMEQASVTKEKARIALEESEGDLAEAILKLKNK